MAIIHQSNIYSIETDDASIISNAVDAWNDKSNFLLYGKSHKVLSIKMYAGLGKYKVRLTLMEQT